MSSPGNRRNPFRAVAQAALLPPAAFVVHQLRYEIAYGSAAGAELRRTGHSYLHSVVPWIVLLLALAVGWFVGALGRAFRGHTSVQRYSLSLGAMWLVCSGALVAIFVCQEFLEGLFAVGHPGGLEGIFGYGGWWAIPVSVCIGLVLAAILHGARWFLNEVSRRRARRFVVVGHTPLAARPVLELWPRRRAPLADGWSGRGPPVALAPVK
jgi:hypothetical protein